MNAKKLSNGQFVLIRSNRQESRGRQSGLGLDVYDAYTGQTRDVVNVIRRRKFNASLSLALGMSDVIQSYHCEYPSKRCLLMKDSVPWMTNH